MCIYFNLKHSAFGVVVPEVVAAKPGASGSEQVIAFGVDGSLTQGKASVLDVHQLGAGVKKIRAKVLE